jgi:nucleotide-binding universal stress UspA family protein
MKKIIAPVDFSVVSKNAALYAANMAAFLNLPLVLMHVTELPVSYGEVPVVALNESSLSILCARISFEGERATRELLLAQSDVQNPLVKFLIIVIGQLLCAYIGTHEIGGLALPVAVPPHGL